MWLSSDTGAVEDAITVRPSIPADVQVGTHLIYMTMGRLADFLLGSDEPSKAESVLAKLFVREANRFSYQFVNVAEMGGEVVGLLLAYPGRVMESLKFPMARQLFVVCGLPGAFRFLRRGLPLMRVKEAEADEYFINSLAVLPGFQGQGIGTHLLSWADSKAKMLDLRKCSLTVEIGNSQAYSLYEHLGYRIVETVKIKQLNQRIGYRGFHRMVKELR